MRTLIEFGDYLGCYFMDDRAPVAALLEAARVLGEREQRPADDVYFSSPPARRWVASAVPTPAEPCPAI
jgi:hypothetical protein